MNCRDAQKLLSAYMDRQLPAWQNAEVAEHVNTCEKCQGAMNKLIQVKRLLRNLPMPALPPEALAVIRSETIFKESRWKEWFSVPWWIPTMAVGAALGGWLFLRLYPHPSRPAAELQIAQPPQTPMQKANVLAAAHKTKGDVNEAVQ